LGEEAILKRGVLRLTFPVQNGVVTDYDAAKLLWEKCYKNEHVDVDHTRHKTLLTECINTYDLSDMR
jgi:actin-related protein